MHDIHFPQVVDVEHISGSRELISYLKSAGPAHLFATAMSGPCAQQIISTFEVILGRDNTTRGQEKLKNLKENSNWFRRRLKVSFCERSLALFLSFWTLSSKK